MEADLLIEALSVVSLHCSVNERDFIPGAGIVTIGSPLEAQVYVDYERNYALVRMDHHQTIGDAESTVLVTDEKITFLTGAFELATIDDGEINRSTGEFSLRIGTIRYPYSVRFEGVCEPGAPIQLPEVPRPRF